MACLIFIVLEVIDIGRKMGFKLLMSDELICVEHLWICFPVFLYLRVCYAYLKEAMLLWTWVLMSDAGTCPCVVYV